MYHLMPSMRSKSSINGILKWLYIVRRVRTITRTANALQLLIIVAVRFNESIIDIFYTGAAKGLTLVVGYTKPIMAFIITTVNGFFGKWWLILAMHVRLEA